MKGEDNLNKYAINNNLHFGLNPANEDNSTSHLQFLDDTMLLASASMREARELN